MTDAAWSEPGAEAVAPGVYRIPLPLPEDGLRAVNVYAIVDGDGLVLVDGGWSLPESLTAFERALADIGHDAGEVTRILVTHSHRDHYTQAVTLRRRYGARVLLGEGERPGLKAIQTLRSNVPVTALRRLRGAGASTLADELSTTRWSPHQATDWEDPDHWLDAGDIGLSTRTLTALPTPGHTRGHLVFLDRTAGLMFTGDHVLPHITPSIGFELEPGPLPLGDFLDSLRLIGDYPDARLLPAHGPVAGSVHARVAELLTHHDTRLAEARAAVAAGGSTAYDVGRLLTWTRRHTPYDGLTPFNQMLAILETAAHLDLLVHRGVLRASIAHDATVYWAVQPPST